MLKIKKHTPIESQWCDYKDQDGTVIASFLIRPVDYQPFIFAMERLARYSTLIDDQLKDGGLTLDMLTAPSNSLLESQGYRAAAAEHLIADWRDVCDDDGKPVSYSPKSAAELLEASPDVWAWLLQAARGLQKQAAQIVEDTTKKPAPASSGSSKTRATRKPKKSDGA